MILEREGQVSTIYRYKSEESGRGLGKNHRVQRTWWPEK